MQNYIARHAEYTTKSDDDRDRNFILFFVILCALCFAVYAGWLLLLFFAQIFRFVWWRMSPLHAHRHRHRLMNDDGVCSRTSQCDVCILGALR